MGLTWILRLGTLAACLIVSVVGLRIPVAIALPLAAPFQFFALPQRNLWLQINRFSPNSRATPMKLWATYYTIHQANAIPNGEPLLNKSGQSLGVSLSHRDWCHAALEGTVQVLQGSVMRLYNFSGRGTTPQTDCSSYFKRLSPEVLEQISRVRFTPSSSSYGYGTQQLKLVPYRTVAVDRTQIPIGSVLFIPAARGQLVTLPSGDRVYHDGFFYAADVGSNIKGNHIDVFLGTGSRNPFPFVTSSANTPFSAFLIQDTEITQALAKLHR